MACGFKAAEPAQRRSATGSRAARSIAYVEEDEPLGTAGPVRLAADRASSVSASWSSTATRSPTST